MCNLCYMKQTVMLPQNLIFLMNQKSTIENPWVIPERSHGELASRVGLQTDITTEQLYCVIPLVSVKAVQTVCGCHVSLLRMSNFPQNTLKNNILFNSSIFFLFSNLRIFGIPKNISKQCLSLYIQG